MNIITYKIADTPDLLLQSYRLVYQRYLEVGFCKTNSVQAYYGFHDLLPDTRTFIAEIDGKVIATLSVILDNSAGLPSDHIFSSEVNGFRKLNRKIAEISRFAVHSYYKKYSIAIFQYLFQLLYHSYVISSDVTDCIILVEPRHCKVYKKFGFIEISEVKLDKEADNTESKLMRLQLRNNGKLVQYPCFATAMNDLKGFRLILSDTLLKQQELKRIYMSFASENRELTIKEFKLFNFRSLLMSSYLYKAKLEISENKSPRNYYQTIKDFCCLFESWPKNYLFQLRNQVDELLQSYQAIANDINFNHSA